MGKNKTALTLPRCTHPAIVLFCSLLFRLIVVGHVRGWDADGVTKRGHKPSSSDLHVWWVQFHVSLKLGIAS